MHYIYDSGIIQTNVGYDVQVIMTLGKSTARRLRTKLHRDPYDFQSYVETELWMDDRGWVRVFRATAEEMPMPNPYSKSETLNDEVYAIAERAHELAVQVVSP